MKTIQLNNALREIGLNDNEIFVIKAVLFPNLPKTQREIARMLRLEKSKVHKIELSALDKLRGAMAGMMGVGE